MLISHANYEENILVTAQVPYIITNFKEKVVSRKTILKINIYFILIKNNVFPLRTLGEIVVRFIALNTKHTTPWLKDRFRNLV